MPLFLELDPTTPTTFAAGRITGIEPGSVADDIGLMPGDELLAINDERVEDVIDVQYYGADEYLELLIRRGEELLLYEAERDYNQALGLEFEHPTFDIDIRRCNNLCEFCFVLQMAPRFRRTLYIKDDDYRYSFLFGHFVTLTNLSDHDWWRIETMRLSPLYISVHVTDWQMRRQFLRNPTAPDILPQLRRLADHDIEVHTQLVIVPGFNDGPWLERSIRELADLWPTVQSISVVPVGLTKQHKYKMRPHTSEEAAVTLSFVESLQPQFRERFGVNFVYPTDEWYLVTNRPVPHLDAYDGQELHENGLGQVRYFLDDWEGVKEEIANRQSSMSLRDGFAPVNRQSLILVTGTLFGPTLRQKAAEFATLAGVTVTVLPVVNQRLGETITVAGLLMAEDVLAALAEEEMGNSLIILPRVMFDHPDRISLDDIAPQSIANQLQRPVALADTLGDVWDALTGQSSLLFWPDS
jgi:putative radical SAM enzyme (TIGR03279 family)